MHGKVYMKIAYVWRTIFCLGVVLLNFECYGGTSTVHLWNNTDEPLDITVTAGGVGRYNEKKNKTSGKGNAGKTVTDRCPNEDHIRTEKINNMAAGSTKKIVFKVDCPVSSVALNEKTESDTLKIVYPEDYHKFIKISKTVLTGNEAITAIKNELGTTSKPVMDWSTFTTYTIEDIEEKDFKEHNKDFKRDQKDAKRDAKKEAKNK